MTLEIYKLTDSEIIELKNSIELELHNRKGLKKYLTRLSNYSFTPRLKDALRRYESKNNIYLKYLGDVLKVDLEKLRKQRNVGRTTIIELAELQLELKREMPKL